MTPECIDSTINSCRNELVEEAYVQTEAAIRAASNVECDKNNRLMDDLLSYVKRQIQAGKLKTLTVRTAKASPGTWPAVAPVRQCTGVC